MLRFFMLNRRFPLSAIVASGLVALSGCATNSPSVNRVALPPATEHVPAHVAEHAHVPSLENVPAPKVRTTIVLPDEERPNDRSSELAQLRNVWQHAMHVDRQMAVECIADMSRSKTSADSNLSYPSGNWVYRNGRYVRQPSRVPSTQAGVSDDANHRACFNLSAALSRQSVRMTALSAPGAVNRYLLYAKTWAMDCANFGLHDRECSGNTVLSVLRREKADASASLNLADNQGNP